MSHYYEPLEPSPLLKAARALVYAEETQGIDSEAYREAEAALRASKGLAFYAWREVLLNLCMAAQIVKWAHDEGFHHDRQFDALELQIEKAEAMLGARGREEYGRSRE